jgi:hypothetical protein
LNPNFAEDVFRRENNEEVAISDRFPGAIFGDAFVFRLDSVSQRM